MSMSRLVLIAILALPLLFAGSVSTRAELAPEQITSLANDLIKHHAVPRYQALARTTKALAVQATRFCATPGTQALADLQKYFTLASASWMGVQHIRFGPVLKDDRFYRFQYWPDKHGQGSRQLRRLFASDSKPDFAIRPIEKMSVALQGFGTFERLLFGPGNDELKGFKCKLMVAIGGNLSSMAASLFKDWQNYQPKSNKQVVLDFFRSFADQLQTIKLLKLDRVLDKSIKKARVRRVENRWSKHSLLSIAENLKALEALATGENGGKGLNVALDDDDENRDYANSISEGLRFGARFAASRKLSLAKAVKDKTARGQVVFLASHIQNIYDTTAEFLAPALGVTLGFNALDGD